MMTIQDRSRAARVVSAADETETGACGSGGERAIGLRRADHAMHRCQEVASRERLGDDMFHAKRFGDGGGSAESRSELARYGDHGRLRVGGLAPPQPFRAPLAR